MDWQSVLRTPEPFDAGPLRRHGDRLAGPVACSLRCGKLDFAPPDWPPGRDALRGLSVLLSGAFARAVQGRVLRVRQLPDWRQGRQAMEGVFGFHLAHHFFHAAPLGWVSRVRLTEPQVTKAIAHLLHSEDPVTRGGRVQALLGALGSRMEGVPGKAGVTAEALVAGQQQRMDLLVEWRDGQGVDRAAVIEAKFDHLVTESQLKTYCDHVLKHYRGAPLLFVVSPSYRKSDARVLADNEDWCWKSWRSLLLAYDRFLDPQHDDEDFRRFRRTLWDRAG